MADVLILQDDAPVRRLITDVCQGEGHDVTQVGGMHETLHYLATRLDP